MKPPQSITSILIILATVDNVDAGRRDGLGAPRPDHEEAVSTKALNFMVLEREPIDRISFLDESSTDGNDLEWAPVIEVPSFHELEYGFEREPIDRESLLKRSIPPSNGNEFEWNRDNIMDDVTDEEERFEVLVPTLDQPVTQSSSVARRLRRPNEPAGLERRSSADKESMRNPSIPLVSPYCKRFPFSVNYDQFCLK